MKTKTMTVKKTLHIGTIGGMRVFIRVEFSGGKLSITGVEGPMANGDCRGSAGQIIIGFKEYDDRDYQTIGDIKTLGDIKPSKGWSHETIRRLFDTWDRWHNNDMRPGCEHQTRDKWADRPIDPTKPVTAYGKHFEGQKQDSWNMLTWVRPDEHPEGLLTKPCPECGYKYGTAWKCEEVPDDVLKWLDSLPESPIKPAWV